MTEEDTGPCYYPFDEIECTKFETSVVRRLMKRYEIPSEYETRMRDDFVALDTERKVEMLSKTPMLPIEEDSPRLMTLHSFHRLFPTFPIRLVAWKSRYIVEKCSLASLFRHPEQLDPFVVYDNLFGRQPDVWKGYWVGLAIDWPTMEKCGGLVLHNQPIATEIPGMRMLWVSPQGKQLVIETLDTVLETMDKRCSGEDGWAPLFDPYHENENDPRMIPTRRLVPVTQRVGGAFEDRVDLDTIDETDNINESDNIDEANIADQD